MKDDNSKKIYVSSFNDREKTAYHWSDAGACLSSLRAWVRFSSWSWRWMFSSISAWIVSCSSKLRLCRTISVKGMQSSAGRSPLMASSTSSDAEPALTGASPSRVREMSRCRNDCCRILDQLKLEGRWQQFMSFQSCGWKAASGLL